MAKIIRISFCLLLIFISTISYSLERADSVKTRLKAGATVSLNSNGIAPIPAFSLDKPAIIAAISLAKGRLSYDPTLAYGLDMRPWIIDNFLQYKIVCKPDFEFKAGIIFSTFFSDYKLTDETILQGERYFTFTCTGAYKFSPKSSLSLAYWNDRGQEQGSLLGHFLSLIGERTDLGIGKHVLLSVIVQLFYINYTGKNDGLFISPKISFSVRNVPFAVFFQATQALDSNISPFPGFRWNLGLAYVL